MTQLLGEVAEELEDEIGQRTMDRVHPATNRPRT
jgi:hypothetical protein